MIRPTSALSPRLIVVLAAAALLLLTLWFGGAPSAYGQAPAGEQTVEVGVTDADGDLSDGDVDLLRTETERLDLPPQVTHVEYLVFAEGRDNLNDTVERFAQSDRPDLVSEDTEKWAPGRLLVAVSWDPQRNGIYCGDDVCAAMDLFEGRHLDGALEAMKDPLRRENTAAGLLAGATAAADPTVLAEEEEFPPALGWVLGGIGVLGAGGAGAAVVASRKKKAATARERFDRVSQEYGRVAGELDGIDVRANSLRSPLADDELRAQWLDVRGRFLELDTVMSRLDHLRPDSTDADFRKAADDIDTADTTVAQMMRAETNIDEMFRMEQGDADVRRRQLGELHEDMLEAALGTSDERLATEARELDARADELARDTAADDFMDRYARLVVDYRVVVEAIRAREMADVETASDAGDRRAPRLYDRDWRVGHGYGGFVPFAMVSSWHAHDVQAAQAASSGTTTGYANASFSGAGGSSSF